MRRLPLLGFLVGAAIVAASAWLVIDAQSDPEPLPTVEHLPRDEDQSQQQESQDQPEPDPEEEAGNEPADDVSASDDTTRESQEDKNAEPTEPVELSTDPVDVLIAALDVPRPPIEPAPVPQPATVLELETYIVEEGDTLADITQTLDIELHDLIAANQLNSPDLLYIGQELAVPVAVVVAEPVEESGPSYEPVEIAPAVSEEGIVYGTITDQERGVINSAVIVMSEQHPNVRLIEACIDGARRTYITGLQLPEGPSRIYWRFDEGPLSTDRWTAIDQLVESTDWCPFLHTLDEHEGIKRLWIRIGGHDVTFAVEHWIPDEIRLNFTYCGQ